MRRGGIEYVEVRSLDLSLFDPVGINQNVMRFMEAFLVYALLTESRPLEDGDWAEINRNQSAVAKQGRDPEFRLFRRGVETSLREWASELLEGIEAVAEVIDAGSDRTDYRDAVACAGRTR